MRVPNGAGEDVVRLCCWVSVVSRERGVSRVSSDVGDDISKCLCVWGYSLCLSAGGVTGFAKNTPTASRTVNIPLTCFFIMACNRKLLDEDRERLFQVMTVHFLPSLACARRLLATINTGDSTVITSRGIKLETSPPVRRSIGEMIYATVGCAVACRGTTGLTFGAIIMRSEGELEIVVTVRNLLFVFRISELRRTGCTRRSLNHLECLLLVNHFKSFPFASSWIFPAQVLSDFFWASFWSRHLL